MKRFKNTIGAANLSVSSHVKDQNLMRSISRVYLGRVCSIESFIRFFLPMSFCHMKKFQKSIKLCQMVTRNRNQLIQRILSMKSKEFRQNRVMIITRIEYFKRRNQTNVKKTQMSIRNINKIPAKF